MIGSILLTLASCYDEKDLTPSGDYAVVRFKFPQGDNAWDYDIKNIHDQYGVYLIYKEISEQDLNRMWTSLGTGYMFAGEDLNDEQAAFYVDFLKQHIFNYISPEIAQHALPAKIYMLDNFRKYNPGESGGTGGGNGGDTGGTDTGDTGGDTGTGGTGTGGTGTGGTGGTGTDTGTGSGTTPVVDPNFVPLKTDGFDYWALSFTADEMQYMNAYSAKIKRDVFIYLMIQNAMNSGIIEEPAAFTEGMDYKTAFYNDMDIENNKADKSDPNYYKNRGFVEMISADFTSELNRAPFALFEYTDPSVDKAMGAHRDFLFYIRAALYYPEADFRAYYPIDLYPLINKRYDIVVGHIKTVYGIDLQGIAEGPEGDN